MDNHNNDRQRDLPAQDPVLEVVLHPQLRHETMEKQSSGLNLVLFRVRFLLVSRWWNINEDMRWGMSFGSTKMIYRSTWTFWNGARHAHQDLHSTSRAT